MSVAVAPRRATSARWVPAALVLLSVIPVVTGSLRFGELLGGPHLMPADPRIDAFPLPVAVHIATVIPYALLGAFQFSSRLRRSHPRWHRMAGRVLVVLGLVVGLSGLWITLAYPLKPGTGVLLYGTRLVVGTAIVAGIVRAFVAIRAGDVPRHRAWMTRSYALALGAGTQTITGAVGPALLGTSALAHDVGMAAAWAINLAVAEWVIRRSSRRRVPRRAVRV